MNHSSKNHRQFVTIFLLVFCPLLFFLITINYFIDPFTIHQTSTRAKVNAIKISLMTHDRLYKAIELARKKAGAVLLGSSRVLVGMDPDDIKAITEIDTYNAAFNGASFEEIYYYFEHALHHQPDLKVVVIGLDFLGFDQRKHVQPDFNHDRLKSKPICWRDFTNSLLSKDAIRSSFETFTSNVYQNLSPPFLPNGQANMRMDIMVKNDILIKGELPYLKMVKATYKNWKMDESKLELFQKLVDKCKDHSIDIKVFFYPKKAEYWAVIYGSGLWPAFENLKRRMSAIYPIWDFSGFNCITMQTVKEEFKQPLYYECSHFHPVVGKLIAEKMFNRTQIPVDFGYTLTPQTIEYTLESMRTQAANWLKQHNGFMEQVEEAMDW